MTDFEIASINAATANFPAIEIKGCLYHPFPNFWKRIQETGLQKRYTNEEDFANALRMILALAFVPLDNVIAYFEELADHLRNAFTKDCDDLLDYFEDNYPQRAPLFSISLWNMFHRTFDELPRTTNHIDGWHRNFQATIVACHSTFWTCLELLKKEDALNRVKILQACGGHNAPPARRRNAGANQRLMEVVDNFQNLAPMRYLRSIARNLGLG